MTEEESSEKEDVGGFLEIMRAKLGDLAGISPYINNEESSEGLKGADDLITAYQTIGELRKDCEKAVEIVENLFKSKCNVEENAATIEQMTEENQRFEDENIKLKARIENFEKDQESRVQEIESLDRENSELEKAKKDLQKELSISKLACEKYEKRQLELESALEESKKVQESLVADFKTKSENLQKELLIKNKESQELTKEKSKLNDALMAKLKEFDKFNDEKNKLRIEIAKLNQKNDDLTEEMEKIEEELNKKDEELNKMHTLEISNQEIRMARVLSQSLSRNDLNMRRPSIDATEIAPEIQIIAQEKLSSVKSEPESDTEEKKENLAAEIKEVIDPNTNISSNFVSYEFKNQDKLAIFTTSAEQSIQTEQQNLTENTSIEDVHLMKKIQQFVISGNIGEIEIIKYMSDCAIETYANPISIQEKQISMEINRIKQHCDCSISMDQPVFNYNSKEIDIQYSKPKNNATTYSEYIPLSIAYPDDITCYHPVFREDKEIIVDLQPSTIELNAMSVNIQKIIEKVSCGVQLENNDLSIQEKQISMEINRIKQHCDCSISMDQPVLNYNSKGIDIQYSKPKNNATTYSEYIPLSIAYHEDITCYHPVFREDKEIIVDLQPNTIELNTISVDLQKSIERVSCGIQIENNYLSIQEKQISMEINRIKQHCDYSISMDQPVLNYNSQGTDIQYSKPKNNATTNSEYIPLSIAYHDDITCYHPVFREDKEIIMDLQQNTIELNTMSVDLQKSIERVSCGIQIENNDLSIQEKQINMEINRIKQHCDYSISMDQPVFNYNSKEIDIQYSKPKNNATTYSEYIPLTIAYHDDITCYHPVFREDKEIIMDLQPNTIELNTISVDLQKSIGISCGIQIENNDLSIQEKQISMEINRIKQHCDYSISMDQPVFNYNSKEIDIQYSKPKNNATTYSEYIPLSIALHDDITCYHPVFREDKEIIVDLQPNKIELNTIAINLQKTIERVSCGVQIENNDLSIQGKTLELSCEKKILRSDNGISTFNNASENCLGINELEIKYQKGKEDVGVESEKVGLNYNDAVNVITCAYKIPKQDYGIELQDIEVTSCFKINSFDIESHPEKHNQEVGSENSPLMFENNAINMAIQYTKEKAEVGASTDLLPLKMNGNSMDVNWIYSKPKNDESSFTDLIKLDVNNSISLLSHQYNIPREEKGIEIENPNITITTKMNAFDIESHVEKHNQDVGSEGLPHNPVVNVQNIAVEYKKQKAEINTSTECITLNTKQNEVDINYVYTKPKLDQSISMEDMKMDTNININAYDIESHLDKHSQEVGSEAILFQHDNNVLNMEIEFKKEKAEVCASTENITLTSKKEIDINFVYSKPKHDQSISMEDMKMETNININAYDIESHLEKHNQEVGSEAILFQHDNNVLNMEIEFRKEKAEVYASTENITLSNKNDIDINFVYSKPKLDQSICMENVNMDINTNINYYGINNLTEKHNQEVGSENFTFTPDINALNMSVEYKKPKAEVYASTENTLLNIKNKEIDMSYVYSKPKQDQSISMEDLKMCINTNTFSHDIESHADKIDQETSSENALFKIEENACNCVIEYHPIKPINIQGSVLNMEINTIKEKAEVNTETELICLGEKLNTFDINCIYSKQKQDQSVCMDDMKLNVDNSVNILSCQYKIPKQDISVELLNAKMDINSNINPYNVQYNKEKHNQETSSDITPLKIEETALNCAIECHPPKNISINPNTISIEIQNIKEKAEICTGTELLKLYKNEKTYDFNFTYSKPKQDESNGMENLCLNLDDSVNTISCLNKIPKQDIGVELIEKNMEICSRINAFDVKYSKEKQCQETEFECQPLKIADSTFSCTITHTPIKLASIQTNIIDLDVSYSKQKQDQSIYMDDILLVVNESVNDFNYSYKIPRNDYGIDPQKPILGVYPRINNHDIENHTEKNSQEVGSEILSCNIDKSVFNCAIEHHPLKQFFTDTNILNIEVQNIKQKAEESSSTLSLPMQINENVQEVNHSYFKQKQDQTVNSECQNLDINNNTLGEISLICAVPKTDVSIGLCSDSSTIKSHVIDCNIINHIESIKDITLNVHNCSIIKEVRREDSYTNTEIKDLVIKDKENECSIEHHPLKPFLTNTNILNIEVQNIKQKVEESSSTLSLPMQIYENVQEVNHSYFKLKKDQTVSSEYQDLDIKNNTLGDISLNYTVPKKDASIDIYSDSSTAKSHVIDCNIINHIESKKDINSNVYNCSIIKEVKREDSSTNPEIKDLDIKNKENEYSIELHSEKCNISINTENYPLKIDAPTFQTSCYNFSQRNSSSFEISHSEYCYIPASLFKKLEITSAIGETTIFSYEEEKEDRSTCDEGVRKPEIEESKKKTTASTLDPQKSFFYLTAQSILLNRPNLNVKSTTSCEVLYSQALKEGIGFNKYYDWIMKALKDNETPINKPLPTTKSKAKAAK